MYDNRLAPAPAWVYGASAVVRRLPAGRYRLMNWLCRCPPAAFLASTDAGDGGHWFRCDLADTIAREVCFTGRYEPQETAVLKAVLRPGDVFVDVGANWGYFTLLAAHRVGAGGRVVSLEPDPRLFPVLAENVARNGLAQVLPLQVAASDAEGSMRLAGFDEAGGNSGLSRLVPGDGPVAGPVFDVPTRPLDALLDELGLGRVDVLKMDIEGAEGLALRGLARLLAARGVSRLLLELHPAQLVRHGHSAAAVAALLSEAEYVPWAIDHSRGATRRAAYAIDLRPESLLHRWDARSTLDDWPHLLWIAPGVELLP